LRIQNNLFHFSIARFVHAEIRLAGNPDSEVVGADTDMRGVDVSAHGGNNGVVNSLQERSLDRSVVDHGSLDRGLVDDGSLDRGLVDEGSLDRGLVDDGSLDRVVDEGSLDSRVVDNGLVDSSGVNQSRVRLRVGLTLGDVRHNGGVGESLQAGEHPAQDGSGQSGVVDTGKFVGQGSLERRVVDQRSLDGRIEDHRFVEGQGVCVDNRSRHLLSLLTHRSVVDEGRLDGGVVDEGRLDGGVVDEGSLDSRVVDDGLVESSVEGQSVGGVDQSRVRFRLSHGHGDESENYK